MVSEAKPKVWICSDPKYFDLILDSGLNEVRLFCQKINQSPIFPGKEALNDLLCPILVCVHFVAPNV